MVAEIITITESKKEFQRLKRTFEAQKRAFTHNPNPSYEFRRDTLIRLKKALLNNQERIIEAINEDYSSRSKDESMLAEFMPVIQSINYTLKHLKEWMRPVKKKVGMLFLFSQNYVLYRPLGVVGIISPWNYPVNLSFGPLVAALASGNRAMIKVSEFTPRTSAVLKEIIANTFTDDLVSIITGGADIAEEFTRLRFDHLLFTGSTAVGKLVMKAAAQNLTPVTLELGGKSPAIIGEDMPIVDAAERIAFGKAFNAGQTCIAPDYVLCPRDMIDAFIDNFKAKFASMYPTLKDNPDFTAIINERHMTRVQGYIDDARNKGARIIEINPANEDFSRGTRKMPVHLILDATPDMTVLQEEIFGPLLPIIPYDKLDDAITYVNERPRPLAMYYFGFRKPPQRYILEKVHAGGVCINDTLMHFAQDDMPFGGVGESGMGHYHGKEGFITFSNAKGVHSKQRLHSGKIVFPPHGTLIHQIVYKLFVS
jgi:coniferyl-aldehyde dehydrogenase